MSKIPPAKPKPQASKNLAAKPTARNGKSVKRLPEDHPPTWQERLDEWSDIFSRPVIQTGLIGVALFVGLASLLSLGYLSGTRVADDNGISKQNFRAAYAFEVIDQEETQRRIDDARLRVDANPVYLPAQPFNEKVENNLSRLLEALGEGRREMLAFQTGSKGQELSLAEKAEKQAELLRSVREKANLSDNSDGQLLIDRVVKRPVNDSTWYKLKAAAEYTVLDRLLPRGLTNEDYLMKLTPIVNEVLPPTLRRNERDVVAAMVSSVMSPNLRIDTEEMERRREQASGSVNPVFRKYRRGEKIVDEGERITPTTARALEAIGQSVNGSDWKASVGVALITAFFTMLGWLYLYRGNDNLFYKPAIAGMISTATILFAALFVVINRLSASEALPVSIYFYPLTCYALILTIFTNARVGIAFTTLLVFLLVMTLKAPFYPLAVMLFSSYVAVYAMTTRRYITDRGQLLWVGIYASLSHIVLIGAVELVVNAHAWQQEHHLTHVLIEMAIGAGQGLLVTVLTLGLLPLFESLFGLVTPYMLMELANHDKPLLKRMQFEAPGTFHHSLMVASLSEAAAEAIGADALLTRVGSLYHDIGKMKRPLFFIENQAYFGVENPHDKLSPRLSKMVITAHPKDSLDMSRQHRLPQCLQDFMTEHHGTMTTAYFYNQACLQEGVENVSKEQFRYGGPKPQSRETAIVMMADACESAVRALKAPTPAQIEERIDKLVQARIDDEQFDECPITFEEIKTIKGAFFRVLRGIQHNRIEYQQSLKDLSKRLPEPNKVNLGRLQQALGGGESSKPSA
jgi:putative nucleotidyltransferase with HDIG domain